MKDRLKTAFYLNAIIVVFEIIATCISAYAYGTSMFKFYTEDSNIFAGIVSLLFIIDYVKKHSISRKIQIMRYVATSCLLVTNIVVLTILSPMYGVMSGNVGKAYLMFMAHGAMIFTHTLCPIISFISFRFFEDTEIEYKHTYLAALPTLTYAIISTTLNVMKVWHGPYPFQYVYEQPIYMSVIWFLIIDVGAYMGAVILFNVMKKKTVTA